MNKKSKKNSSMIILHNKNKNLLSQLHIICFFFLLQSHVVWNVTNVLAILNTVIQLQRSIKHKLVKVHNTLVCCILMKRDD